MIEFYCESSLQPSALVKNCTVIVSPIQAAFLRSGKGRKLLSINISRAIIGPRQILLAAYSYAVNTIIIIIISILVIKKTKSYKNQIKTLAN